MSSFVPSEVVARFRGTSRKLFRPKCTFSDRIVSNCTSAFLRLRSSYSKPSYLRVRRKPPPRGTGRRGTDRIDMNLSGRIARPTDPCEVEHRTIK
jgi:hypothetical protein